MTVLSYVPNGSEILGNISYDFPSYSIGGGDYKFPILVDVFGETAEIPVGTGDAIYFQYMICRCTLACTATITNISAFKSALSPLTLGSYVYEAFGFKKNPAYWNYLNQELQPMQSFSERDTIGDYLGTAAFPEGFQSTVTNGVIADTLYVRLDGALPASSSLGIEYYVVRELITAGSTYNKTSFSFIDLLD